MNIEMKLDPDSTRLVDLIKSMDEPCEAKTDGELIMSDLVELFNKHGYKIYFEVVY